MYNFNDKMYYGWIYLITNNINSKKYIGQTRQTIHKRMIEHKSNAKTINDVTGIDLAIRKYGFDNFTVEQIEEFKSNDEDELINILNESEIYYIKYFDTYIGNKKGYNISKGGNCVNYLKKKINVYNYDGMFINSFDDRFVASYYYKISPEAIRRCCIGETLLCDNADVIFRYDGDTCDKYDYSKLLENKKPIYKFSSTGKLIAEYKNSKDAAFSLNIEKMDLSMIRGRITNAVMYKNMSYGYYWSRDKNFKIKNKNSISINAYNTNGELVKNFNSMSKAAIFANNKRSAIASIKRSCDGINKYPVYDYIWRYKDDDFYKYPVCIKRKVEEEIDQYDLLGNFINTYNNAKEASDINKLGKYAYESIIKCAEGRISYSYNYVWRIKGHPFNEFNLYDSHWTSINCYSEDNIFIKTYPSYIHAARFMFNEDCKKSKKIAANISYATNLSYGYSTHNAYGYKWFRADDTTQPDKSKIIA